MTVKSVDALTLNELFFFCFITIIEKTPKSKSPGGVKL